MRLTAQADYALRTLMYLAVRDDRLATIADIAACYSISKNHLMKVVYQLGQGGFVETVRGRSGGLRLASKPEAIKAGTVVRFMERDTALVECFQADKGACLVLPACRLKGALAQAADAFYEALDQYTLADLIVRRKRLDALFTQGAAS